MSSTQTIIEPADRYQDHDDSLSAARRAVAKRAGVETWRCTAVWGDADGDTDASGRETIVVTVTYPASSR